MDPGNYSYKLTVIVPITKMAGKLELLKSWVKEAIENEVKVILVHDYKDQETSDELAAFVSVIDSIALEFIEGKFDSPGLARNAAMRSIDSEWVAFWDSDDAPEVLKTLSLITEGMIGKKTILVGSFSRVNISNPDVIEHVYFRGSPDSWINQISESPGLWRFVIHRSRLRNLPFSEIRMGEDQLLIEELLEHTDDFFLCNEIIYNYYVGYQFQATQNILAKADISKLVLHTARLYRKSILKYRRALAPYLMRQIASGIKYLEIRILVALAFELIKITRLWMLLEAFIFTLVPLKTKGSK
jgi:glycosyltransferase involved in cell wall biosynthesis